MTDSLESLREVERNARREVDEALRKAASMKAGLPGEIQALREEKARRLAAERRRREEALKEAVSAERDTLLEAARGKLEAVKALEAAAVDRAFALLHRLVTGESGS